MFASCVVVAAVIAFVASTAAAAPLSEAAVTLVRAGTLDISVPESVDLGITVPGTVITGALGTVTVDDTRGPGQPVWTASASSSEAFLVGSGGADYEVVEPDRISYWSGPVSVVVGDGGFTGMQPDVGAAQPLDNELIVVTRDSGDGDNTAEWSPTLLIDVPLATVAGPFAATVTHSVG